MARRKISNDDFGAYLILLIILAPVGLVWLIVKFVKWLLSKRKPKVRRIKRKSSEPSLPRPKYVSVEQASKAVNLNTKKWSSAAQTEFIVIDVETTGLSKETDYLLEVAAVRYRDGKEVDSFSSLINPGVNIPKASTKIHGITDGKVRNAPPIEKALPEYLDFLGESLLVAHNASFDIGFLEVWSRRIGFDPSWKYVDTLTVARRTIDGLPNYKQATVLQSLGHRQSRYHRALDDCRGCAHIMNYGLQKRLETN